MLTDYEHVYCLSHIVLEVDGIIRMASKTEFLKTYHVLGFHLLYNQYRNNKHN